MTRREIEDARASGLHGEEADPDYSLHPSRWGYVPQQWLFPALVLGIGAVLSGDVSISEFDALREMTGAGGFFSGAARWGSFFLAAGMFVLAFASRRCTTLHLFPDYIVYQTGFFTKTKKIYNHEIKTVEVHSSPLGRLLGYGRIFVATSGTDGYELESAPFAAPYGILRYLQVHRREGE